MIGRSQALACFGRLIVRRQFQSPRASSASAHPRWKRQVTTPKTQLLRPGPASFHEPRVGQLPTAADSLIFNPCHALLAVISVVNGVLGGSPRSGCSAARPTMKSRRSLGAVLPPSDCTENSWASRSNRGTRHGRTESRPGSAGFTTRRSPAAPDAGRNLSPRIGTVAGFGSNHRSAVPGRPRKKSCWAPARTARSPAC